TIFGDGGQTRDFCHVSDVVTANLLAASASPDAIAPGVFNIGSGTSVTVNELACAIRSICGSKTESEHREARAGEIKFSQADISRASGQLGYRRSVELSQGLVQLLQKP
ncbi:MAG: GDP-mannose 4,6-dehydratase, partial [Chthoniobacterales bacterium]|nr:GDP-mannose 4,6-dehydratase [Chthoniobacterales bacterium]